MMRGDAPRHGASHDNTTDSAAAAGGVPGVVGVRAVLAGCSMKNLLRFYARIMNVPSVQRGSFTERDDLVGALVKGLSAEGVLDGAGTVARLRAAGIVLVEHAASASPTPPVVDLAGSDEEGVDGGASAGASDVPAGGDAAVGHQAGALGA